MPHVLALEGGQYRTYISGSYNGVTVQVNRGPEPWIYKREYLTSDLHNP